MNRRRFLASVPVQTAAVSGCLETERTAGHRPEPSLAVEPDPDPDEFPVALDARITSNGSAERPPAITVVLGITGENRRTISFPDYAIGLPFDDTVGSRSDGSALGLHDSTGDNDIRYDGCWKGRTDGGGHDASVEASLSPGEQLSAELLLYNDEENDDCWPPGDYRFEQEYHVGDRDDSETLESYAWGFTVTVEHE